MEFSVQFRVNVNWWAQTGSCGVRARSVPIDAKGSVLFAIHQSVEPNIEKRSTLHVDDLLL